PWIERAHGAQIKAPLRPRDLVECDDELLLVGFFRHQPDREQGFVDAWSDANEPDQRLALIHRHTQRHVVVQVRVRSAPLVAWVSVRTHGVVVGTLIWPRPEDR